MIFLVLVEVFAWVDIYLFGQHGKTQKGLYLFDTKNEKETKKNEKKDLHDWMIICSGLPLKGNRQECVGRNCNAGLRSKFHYR